MLPGCPGQDAWGHKTSPVRDASLLVYQLFKESDVRLCDAEGVAGCRSLGGFVGYLSLVVLYFVIFVQIIVV